MLRISNCINQSFRFTREDGSDLGYIDILAGIYSLVQYIGKLSQSKIWISSEDKLFVTCTLFACLLVKKELVIIPLKSHFAESPSNYFLESTSLTMAKFCPIGFEDESFEESSTIYFYTSGSTAEPKMIKKSFLNLFSEVQNLDLHFSSQASNLVSSVSPLHIYGFLFSLLWPLYSGHRVALYPIRFQEELSRLEKVEKYIFISSPAFLKRIFLDTNDYSQRLHTIFSSGGPLSSESANLTANIFGTVPIEIYGSTESGGIAYRTQLKGNTAWTVFPDVKVEVSEDFEFGFMAKSPYIFETQFPMNDKIQKIDDSSFYLVGRMDRIVKIEEKRLSLNEMEELLCEHPWVKDCAILKINKPQRQMSGALVCLKKDLERQYTDLSKAEKNRLFQEYLLRFFDPVLVPKIFRYCEEIPINTQGKKLYTVIQRMFE